MKKELEQYRELIDIVDVPTKSNLLNRKDPETLARYRYLRTEVEEALQRNEPFVKKTGLDMSKELEALEDMRTDVVDFRDIIENSSYSTDEDYKIIKKALQRNEPMKVGGIQELVNEDDKKEWKESTRLHLCPNCKKPVFPFHSSDYNKIKYCEWCGQALDWNE